MGYVVFAQSDVGRAPLGELALRWTTHFDVTLEVLPDAAGTGSDSVGAAGTATTIRATAHGVSGVFRVVVRPTRSEDVANARDAEVRGRAAGMGALAARCPSVWLVSAEPSTKEWLTLDLCALLAFGALGPILPPDGATLLGVRSARERAEKLRHLGDQAM